MTNSGYSDEDGRQRGNGREQVEVTIHVLQKAYGVVTDNHSAHSLNSKIATLTQDVYRIMSNCSPDTELEERKEHLEEFTRRLRLNPIISNVIVTNRRAIEKEKGTSTD